MMKKIVALGVVTIFLLTSVTACSVIGRNIESTEVTTAEKTSNLNDPPHVGITKPMIGYPYLFDTAIFTYPCIHEWLYNQGLSLILLQCSVWVEATDNTSGIDYVDLYIDDKQVASVSNPEEENEYEFQNPFPGNIHDTHRHTVTAVAHDEAGNTANDSIDIIFIGPGQLQKGKYSPSDIEGYIKENDGDIVVSQSKTVSLKHEEKIVEGSVLFPYENQYFYVQIDDIGKNSDKTTVTIIIFTSEYPPGVPSKDNPNEKNKRFNLFQNEKRQSNFFLNNIFNSKPTFNFFHFNQRNNKLSNNFFSNPIKNVFQNINMPTTDQQSTETKHNQQNNNTSEQQNTKQQ